MAKNSLDYVCENCDRRYARWQGQCDECGEWSTITEQPDLSNVTQSRRNLSGAGSSVNPVRLADIEANEARKLDTKISELNRVLAGGLTKGSVSLLTGEPGIGKSTLLLQLAASLANQGEKTLYISAEENLAQIKTRSERIISSQGKLEKNLLFANIYSLEEIVNVISSDSKLEFIIIDSIQTITSTEITGVPGGTAQVKYCANELTSIAKNLKKTMLIVGHINKEGSIAGPKILEHLVDTVLHFETQSDSELRILRSQKNRFGDVAEVGLFLMQENGLKSISNPGQYFIAGQDSKSLNPGVVRSIIYEGKRPLIVEVQCLAVKTKFSYPKLLAEGISNNRLQILNAVANKYLGLKTQEYDIYLNVARGLTVTDRALDLAVVLAIYSSIKNIPLPTDIVVFGEATLSGKIIKPTFFKRRVGESKSFNYRYISADNVSEVSRIEKYIKNSIL